MAMPYLLYLVGGDGIVLMVDLPMCLRDLDLDGRTRFVPERSLASGEGLGYRESHATLVPLALSPGRRGPSGGRGSLRS
jgi:hypothetical protein